MQQFFEKTSEKITFRLKDKNCYFVKNTYLSKFAGGTRSEEDKIIQ